MDLSDIRRCFASPSVFNDCRFWTATASAPYDVWLPYFEPQIAVDHGLAWPRIAQPDMDAALIFRALGDATRFAIVCALGRQPSTATGLAELFGVSKPTITHHLHILREASLLTEESAGAQRLIRVNRAALEGLTAAALDRIFDTTTPFEMNRSREQR